MREYHKLKEIKMDLSNAILRHSADQCIAYKIVNGEPVYLGYYYPDNYDNANKYRTFIFVHGGGWHSHQIFGDQAQWQGDYLGYLARYYADRGFLCVSIDYRLIRELGQVADYELIDSYEDCCDAVDYVLAHADEYGVDRQEVYLLGESAGGHLAGALATFHYDRIYSFRKVFLINPITDLLDYRWNTRVPLKSRHAILSEMSMDERAKFLSPLYQINENTSGVVLVHGAADQCVLPEHSERFYDRMQAYKRPCDLHMIEGTTHAFLLAEFKDELAACKMGIEIIGRYL